MRIRSEKEKEVMGKVKPIFRDLGIKEGTRGYMPLLDLICYAYANPEENFPEMLEFLEKSNYYVGVKNKKTDSFSLIPSMERTIETALEGTSDEILSEYKLEKLGILVQPINISEQEKMEERLLLDLGEKYVHYNSHEERVIVFFVKKILKNM